MREILRLIPRRGWAITVLMAAFLLTAAGIMRDQGNHFAAVLLLLVMALLAVLGYLLLLIEHVAHETYDEAWSDGFYTGAEAMRAYTAGEIDTLWMPPYEGCRED